ncbi:MAG: hypothetical protein RLZZ444_3270 [Pseudomonadota bacterium]
MHTKMEYCNRILMEAVLYNHICRFASLPKLQGFC